MVYTVCHSICIFQMHYWVKTPKHANLRTTIVILGVPVFRVLDPISCRH